MGVGVLDSIIIRTIFSPDFLPPEKRLLMLARVLLPYHSHQSFYREEVELC